MKRLFILFAFCNVLWSMTAQTAIRVQQITLQLSVSANWDSAGHSIHKTPPQVPVVCLELATSTLFFENPCYETTLELVIPGTDAAVYSYDIPDGTDTVQLPSTLSGEYELHIHRGNYCFWGVIEL